MKNYFRILFLSLVILLLFSCKEEVIEYEEVLEEKIYTIEKFTDTSLNKYNIEAVLDVENSIIKAKQIFTYTNNENIDLEEIYFHLYPNAFKKDDFPSLFDNTVNINDRDGRINISSIKVNGIDVKYSIEPIDTVLKIYSNFIIEETYIIELIYDVEISYTNERFGVVDGIYNLGNWYPILAVYDEDGWNLDPYYSIGDPFYSEVSNYDINFTVPKEYIVSGSGYIYEIDKFIDKKYSFRGDRIRDFVLVVSDDFKIASKEVDGTVVSIYYPKNLPYDNMIGSSLLYATNTLKLYNEKIGIYPYKTYNVVVTNFPSGMEYPGLVFISKDYYNSKNTDRLREVVVHETIHQWFYGIIGVDEIDEGWIDEGLTSYLTSYYDLAYLGEKEYNSVIDFNRNRIEKIGGIDNVVMMKPSSDYQDWTEYGLAAYSKSLLMNSDLYNIYGEEEYFKFLKKLYDDYKYKILKTEDFIKEAELVFPGELNEFFENWLN